MLKRMLNLVALLIALAVNYLANALPINNLTTGDVSDAIPVLFVPAGYAFAIWGVIYIALLAFVGYALFSGRQSDAAIERIGYWFVASCLLNAGWLVCWHYQVFLLSQIVMLGLLVSLIAIYVRLGIGRDPVSRSEYWWVQVPFSIYLGWISVATIANFSVTLYSLGWGGWGIGDVAWTIIMLVVGAALATAMIRLRHDVPFPLVIVWAYVAIAVKWLALPAITITSLAGALLIVVVLAMTLLNRTQTVMRR